MISCPVAMKETRGFSGFYWLLKSEKSFCERLKSIYQEQKLHEKRVRVLTRIEANVGSAFMSNCILQLHCTSGSACLEILVIPSENLTFLEKEDAD